MTAAVQVRVSVDAESVHRGVAAGLAEVSSDTEQSADLLLRCHVALMRERWRSMSAAQLRRGQAPGRVPRQVLAVNLARNIETLVRGRAWPEPSRQSC